LKRLKHYHSVLFLVIAVTSYAQLFERAEQIVGLGDLEENNGIAVADYDQDNDLDFFIVGKAKDDPSDPKTLSRLYRNNNDGSFTDVTAASGIANLYDQAEGFPGFEGLDGFKYGAFWGDFDNDIFG